MKYEFYSSSLGMTFNPAIHTPASPTDRMDDGYAHLEALIKTSFEAAIASRDILFTTDCHNLYDTFLAYLPADARQHYNCNTCRNFVNRYGGLVTIDDNGDINPIMWRNVTPYNVPFFANAVANMRASIQHSKVTGVFVTSEKRLGMPKTGVWSHMSVDVPKWMIYKSYLKNAGQEAAEKKEEFNMLMGAIHKYSVDTIQSAINLLHSDTLYRGAKFIDMAEWFLKLKKNLIGKNSHRWSNTIWKAAATAPNGFCHISSSMIGTLMDDIQEGYDFETIKRRFNEKMNPLQYQRPQAAPSAGNIRRAEEIVAKLGLEDSLKRRYARLDEVRKIWVPQQSNPSMTSSGIFAGLKTKNEPTKNNYDDRMPAVTMTWEKFQRTVLPTAKKIEMHIDRDTYRKPFAAIVGPEDVNANPIILWDKEDARNPYSWYMYSGGSSADDWNLSYYKYIDVTGITLQPNMWQDGYEHVGKGVMFILKGCKDRRPANLCLFPELLRGELKEVRSTIEEYSKQNKMSGHEDASACGIMLHEGKTWNYILRVTTDVGVRKYKLDRWD